MGGSNSVEQRLAARSGLQFVGVPAGGVHGVAPWQAGWNLTRLVRGFLATLKLGRRERPEALFVTGGYASLPVALAAWVLRVPVLVYLPDIEPGLAVRLIARVASRVAVTAEESRAYFPLAKTVVTGYPVRAGLTHLGRAEARIALGLTQDEPVVLVFGGSRGARSINQAVAENLEALLEETQVMHVSGELDWPWVAEQAQGLPSDLQGRYHACPYLHEEMGLALAAADLAVCRAGASTLGELPAFGLPGILVPYPHAWRYQKVNAEWLARRGAAVVVEDGRLAQALLPTVRSLLADPERMSRMRRQAQALARPDAAQRLAQELRQLTGGTAR